MLTRRCRILLVVTVVVVVSSACGSHSPTSVVKLDATYKPASSLRAAVTEMLKDEQQQDHEASFHLLSPDSRTTYKDAADWTNRRHELPAVTGFQLESSFAGKQMAVVDHAPGLDPFIGLSPAQERQTWVGRQYNSGWLVDADPQTDPIFPNDSQAPVAVRAWVEAVQSCNKDKAHALQALPDLFGNRALTLCGVSGPVAVSSAAPLAQGPASADIIAQYTTDALTWARSVAVTTPVSLNVIVAPIGSDWKVLGLY